MENELVGIGPQSGALLQNVRHKPVLRKRLRPGLTDTYVAVGAGTGRSELKASRERLICGGRLLPLMWRRFLASVLLVVLCPSARVPSQAQSGTENRASFKDFLARAQDGDVNAMNDVGVALAEGTGTTADQRKAVVWFRRGAELGNAHGAGNLGLHYVRGAGLRRDKVLAAKWFIICHSLDGLRCFPPEYVEPLRLTKSQLRTARSAAVEWLRARPDLKNNFGERPWLGEGDDPTTLRSKPGGGS